jgi:hypothetical protein
VSENQATPALRHVIGLILATLVIGLLFLVWQFGLDYLNGTIFEELRYVIFAVLVIGLLSGLQNLLSRFDG